MNKKFELKKQIIKKQSYIIDLQTKLDNLKVKHYPYTIPEKEHKFIHNRLFKNVSELKVLKDELKRVRGW